MTDTPDYYLQMGNGLVYDLLNPDPSNLNLSAIATGLAHTNRFNGQGGAYSVAQHCVLGCVEMRRLGQDEENQLGFLFHDAHEFITGDVCSPIKKIPFLKEAWKIFESIHEECMAEWVGLPIHSMPFVRDMDMAMVNREADVLLGGRTGPGWPPNAPADVTIELWDPEYAYGRFMEEAERLGRKA